MMYVCMYPEIALPVLNCSIELSSVVISCQQLSTVVNSCQQLSTVVNSCQQLSTVVNSCQECAQCEHNVNIVKWMKVDEI